MDSNLKSSSELPEQDKDTNEHSKKECISCGEKGHYYYECNNGDFFKAANALVLGLRFIDLKNSNND